MTTICTSGQPDYTHVPAADIPLGALIVDTWAFGRGGALPVTFTRRVLEPLHYNSSGTWIVECRGDVYLGSGTPHGLPVLTSSEPTTGETP
ncbi:hypothetical protein ACFFMN_23915 [Planobispora siamensis]|uniref:Uncharacterized protein n=1 Tax=Planobispora siamensis TaxID=936338 RepID=A0A8J3SLD1_9ACTN|nr:hypothetical protein [Planobispora siamensis]GIH95384.1 hypothetical protein Psi01_60140 [Planobispora siamensis]